MEEQGRNNLHVHMVLTIAGMPRTVSQLLTQLRTYPNVTIDKIVGFAEHLESHNAFSDPEVQKANVRCQDVACTREAGKGVFIAEPIPEHIKNAQKPLGFNFPVRVPRHYQRKVLFIVIS